MAAADFPVPFRAVTTSGSGDQWQCTSQSSEEFLQKQSSPQKSTHHIQARQKFRHGRKSSLSPNLKQVEGKFHCLMKFANTFQVLNQGPASYEGKNYCGMGS